MKKGLYVNFDDELMVWKRVPTVPGFDFDKPGRETVYQRKDKTCCNVILYAVEELDDYQSECASELFKKCGKISDFLVKINSFAEGLHLLSKDPIGCKNHVEYKNHMANERWIRSMNRLAIAAFGECLPSFDF